MGSRAVAELAATPGVELVTIVGRTEAALERAREHALEAQERSRKRSLTAQYGVREQAATAQKPVLTHTLAAREEARGHAAAVAAGPADEEAPAAQAPGLEQAPANGGPAAPSARIELEVADARNRDAVVDVMQRHDVALGALGPFYIFEEPMVEAAIAARTPYVSLCDDADAAAAALKHDGAARAAGVTVLTGLGWTPGLTNVLALRAAAVLDKTTAVTIAWAGSGAESGGTAVALHTLHIFDGKVATFAGGRLAHVPAGAEPEYVEFPPPLGRVQVCHVGHPEPLTLPARLPGVRAVALKGGLVEPTLHHLAVLTGRLGLGRTHGMRAFLARVLVPLIPALSRLGPRRPAISGVVVRVTGEKDGRAVTVQSAATAPMRDLTSIPLVVGALWMAQGRIKRPGVLAPDAPGLLPPDEFLAELARRGLPVTHSELPGPGMPP